MDLSVIELDHVYQSGKTDGFRNVRVKMYPDAENSYFNMEITSAEEISVDDLSKVLDTLWTDKFAKLHIDPVRECNIRLTSAGVAYSVEITQTAAGMTVKELRKEDA